ncbi:MAG: ketoacyl-ACP synthase III [Flavobacteriaceae bacterium]|nr:ketoacyl-ACP synthase III [Flavobacteriaceae bacterium]
MFRISAIESFFPKKIVTNEDLQKEFPEWSPEKIFNKVGVKQRHTASQEESVLELAVGASEKLLKNFDRDKIDFVLFCTQSPDYHLPTTACVLQDRLGLRKNIGALDFNLGCSGFVYGLSIAKGLISTGVASTILLVTAETYTKYLRSDDKSNRTIFGDGAAATLLEKDETKQSFQFELGTDGSGYDNLIVRNGGGRNPILEGDTMGNCLYMNGPKIFAFTIEKIPLIVNEILKKNNLTKEEIDYFVFHQANKHILTRQREILEIPEERFYINLEKRGNTVSSTIPLALKDLMDSGKLMSGQKIMLVGFGVGLSWGATIVEI